MKAHIRSTVKPLALLYNLPENGAGYAVHIALEEMEIPVRDITAAELDETVGTLADAGALGATGANAAQTASAQAAAGGTKRAENGESGGAATMPESSSGKAATEAAPAAPEAQLLLMANFPEALINELLNNLRAEGITVPLTAVMTKHNRTWRVRALLEELLREKQAVEGYEA